MPQWIEPMLAELSDLPPDVDHYSFEYKWDGVRALAFRDRSLVLRSRNRIDITARYPELHALAGALGRRRVILDGEIVSMDQQGRPSFALLQQRMHVIAPSPSLVRRVPAYYIIFDVLYLDGGSLLNVPFTQRRKALEQLKLLGEFWRISPAAVGRGRSMLETAKLHGLEGIVAKRLDSVYEPGRRSGSWRKTKIVQRQEFVIGGWTSEKGNPNRVGALLLGYYDTESGDRRHLHYAGSVGSGFNEETHRRLFELLNSRRCEQSPFDEKLPKRDICFVRPELIAEVEFRRWPEGGFIQMASFKGLRTDKPASQVVKEKRAPATDMVSPAVLSREF